MTVIVYRNGVLAADRMQSTANLTEAVRTKIFKVVHQGETPWAVALCGTTKGTAAILKHLEAFGVDGPPIEEGLLHSYEKDHTYGFAVNAYGSVWQVYGDGTWLPQEEQDYFVDGAGYHFAMGACAAGASAVLAVLLTGAQHCHCGYGATSVNVKEYLLHNGHQTAHSEESLDDNRQSPR